MIKIVSVDPLGKILMVSTSVQEPSGDGQHEVPLDSPISPQTHHYLDGEFVELPPAPSRLLVFDYALKAWVDPRSASDVILAQIHDLEASITPRRMREAAMGTDGGWLAAVDAEIAALRMGLV